VGALVLEDWEAETVKKQGELYREVPL